MDYVTTNIRLPEEDYLKLKKEAFEKNISLSAVIREKIRNRSDAKISSSTILRETKKLAQVNAVKLRGWDSLKVLREIRSQGK